MAKMPPRMTYLRASKSDDTLKQMLETLVKRVEEMDEQMTTRMTEMGAKISSLEAQRLVQVPESVQEEPATEEQLPSEAETGVVQQKEVRRGDSRTKVKVSCFGGCLRPEELFDWIGELERFFDWDDIADPQRVKFACTKLRGHTALWWERLQKDRMTKGQEKIQSWEEMVSKLKSKFLPTN